MRREKIIRLVIRPKAESESGYEKIAFLHKSASHGFANSASIRKFETAPKDSAAIVCSSAVRSRRIIYAQQHSAAASDIDIAVLGLQRNFAQRTFVRPACSIFTLEYPYTPHASDENSHSD